MKVLVLNGPNLNLLGQREPDTYGASSLGDLEEQLTASFPDVTFSFEQSNVEGELVDHVQDADTQGFAGVVLNAGGYTHTSVALRDAIAAVDVRVVEVHISNVYARESFRHTSLIAAVCSGTLSGFGLYGYHLAVRSLVENRPQSN